MKKTVVNQMELLPSGVLQIRFAKQRIENHVVVEQKWHRTCIEPGVPVEAQMALVNEHLAAMEEDPVGPEDIATINAFRDAG